MQQQTQKHDKKTLKIASIVIVIIVWLWATAFSSNSMASETDEDTNTILPTENQYLEMRATEIKEVEGKNRQVTFELWGYDIAFKRI